MRMSFLRLSIACFLENSVMGIFSIKCDTVVASMTHIAQESSLSASADYRKRHLKTVWWSWLWWSSSRECPMGSYNFERRRGNCLAWGSLWWRMWRRLSGKSIQVDACDWVREWCGLRNGSFGRSGVHRRDYLKELQLRPNVAIFLFLIKNSKCLIKLKLWLNFLRKEATFLYVLG